MRPWLGSILHAKSFVFLHSRSDAAQGPGRPNPSWMGKGSLSQLCSPCAHSCLHARPEIPETWGAGLGLTPCIFGRRSCCEWSRGHCSLTPLHCWILSAFNTGLGWRCWCGAGPVCGVTRRARGHLVSPTAWLCCGDVTAGQWHEDGSACPNFRLFPALLGSFQGFGDSGKFKFPFLGRLDQREAVVRL